MNVSVLEWHDWVDEKSVPKELLDKPCLFKLDKARNNLQVGSISSEGISIIGNMFIFDCTILKFADLSKVL